jgi:hypothetical protein
MSGEIIGFAFATLMHCTPTSVETKRAEKIIAVRISFLFISINLIIRFVE